MHTKTYTRKDFDIVIGMEFHLQTNTQTKLFSRASMGFSGDHTQPNTHVSLVDSAMPGALPSVNQECIKKGIITALALNMKIAPYCMFDRKHYSYPDLPLKYQITQFFNPLGFDGYAIINNKKIRLNRLALEADAGKSIHHGAYSHIDLNRCGAPLMEIVTEPDMDCEDDAVALFAYIRSVARYIKTSDANMEKGQLRADVNVSINLKNTKDENGNSIYGTRVEIKNLNSMNFTHQALIYEINRQIACWNNNEKIHTETRTFDPATKQTITMRVKETEADYRYINEPDLVPIAIDPQLVEQYKNALPLLPNQKIEQWVEQHHIASKDAKILAENPETAEFFDQCSAICKNPLQTAKWILGDFAALSNKTDSMNITPAMLAELINTIDKGKISTKQGKEVFELMHSTGKTAIDIINEFGMSQITDPVALEALAQQVVDLHPEQVKNYRDGNKNLFGFFVGTAIKMSDGKANPQDLNQHMRKILG